MNLTLEKKVDYLSKLFCENGYEVSKIAKNLHSNKEEVSKILYGETVIKNVSDIFFNESIFEYIKDKKHFCDLGSGTGNVCLSMAMMKDFESITGIELLEYLHLYSCSKKEIFINDFPEFKNKINFINKDLLTCDLSKYDCLFINYPFSNDNMHHLLREKLENEVAVNSVMIFGIEGISSKKFEIIDKISFDFSWGYGTCSYYLKVS